MNRRTFAAILIGVVCTVSASRAEQVAVRVATWNIQVFDGGDAVQFNAAKSVLLRIGADVVCVQEMADAAAFVNLATAAGYPHVALASSFGDIDFNADWSGIMSMHPFASSSTQTAAALSGDPNANDVTRNFIIAAVLVPDAVEPLRLAGNHWKAASENSDEFRRSIESKRALQTVQTLDSATVPYFIVGDMNDDILDSADFPATFTALPSGLPPSFELGNDIALPIINSVFDPLLAAAGTHNLTVVNPFQLDGSDATFPASGRRIDYVWHSDAVEVVGSEVYDSHDEGLPGGLPKFGSPLPSVTTDNASDHLLVFADVLISAVDERPPFDPFFDLDGDGTVGLFDYAVVALCLSGPDIPAGPGCEPADLDLDLDVDLRDAGIIFTNFTNVP